MLEPVTMQGMTWIFRNFEGKEGKYNKPGTKNFGVLLDEKVGTAMYEDGWNVKKLKPREEDLEEDPTLQPKLWLPVEAAYDKGRPPRIFVISSSGMVKYDEEDVVQLDWVRVATDEGGNPMLDLIVNPYSWTQPNGDSGVKAYLQSLYVTIDEDELEKKYAELKRQ